MTIESKKSNVSRIAETREKSGIPYMGAIISRGEAIDLYAKPSQLEPHIPKSLIIAPSPNLSQFALVLDDSEVFGSNYDPTHKVLKINGRLPELATELPFIAYMASESLRQEKGRFTLHAAGLSKGNQSVLLMGEKGGGKTSVAIGLCRDYGWSLVGNDVEVVGLKDDGVYLYEGDGVFRVRPLGAGAEFIKPGQLEDQDEFDQKVDLNPSDLRISLAQNLPTPVTGVFQVFLNSVSNTPTRESNPDRLGTVLRISENLGRYIHGSITPVLDSHLRVIGMLPSLDSPLAQKNRARFINVLMNQVEIRRITGGDYRTMAKFIADQFGIQNG